MAGISKYIENLKIRNGVTAATLAAYLDVDQCFLTKIEKDQKNITKDQVVLLAGYFDVDVKKLLTVYLSQLVLQSDQKVKNSKRFQQISTELSQLHNRHIETKVYLPSFPLDRYIENMICYSGNNKVHPFERVLPDGVARLVIKLDEYERVLVPASGNAPETVLKKTWVSGVQKNHLTWQLQPYERSLTIRFVPGGFYALTGIPLSEIENSFIDTEMIFGPAFSTMQEHLLHCSDHRAIFSATGQFFLEKISSENKNHSLVSFIANHIDTPSHELAGKTGYSKKHIIHLFKKHVGTSPKYFHRIRRFNKSLREILAAKQSVNWSDIAFNNGYYDQSHFINEFNHFTGMNPNLYMETGSTCSRLLHLKNFR